MSNPSTSGGSRATVDSEALHESRSPSLSDPAGQAQPKLHTGGALAAGTGVLCVGHGSRRVGANQEFEAFVGTFRAAHSELVVGHGYIELASPSLDEALDALVAELESDAALVIAPLFLFRAGHYKNDLALAADAARVRHRGRVFRVAEPLGVDLGMIALVWRRILSVAPAGPRTTVLLVGRGSSDPAANAEFCRLARLLFEGRELEHVEPCFIGICAPDVPSSLARLARLRPGRIVVVPYLLFAGVLVERLAGWVGDFAAEYPWISVQLAGHLEADPAVIAAFEARLAEALGDERTGDCDACQYRTPMPGRFREVGGLRAMLWSLRHNFTHNQAMPSEHAHAPLTKHVLVCGNADCADAGSLALLADLRRRVKAEGGSKSVRVTRTSCMGRCGEGPTVAVYPDGIWYREVRPDDAAELVREHLFGDRLVGRLVDNIMQ